MKKIKIIIIASLLTSVGAFAQKDNSDKKDSVFVQAEQLPAYKGGLEAFYTFAASNLTYPEEAKKNNVEGKVYVQFVVAKDGKLEEIKVLKGIGHGCDKAAIELIKKSADWIPGRQKGKIVKVQMTLPISFKLS